MAQGKGTMRSEHESKTVGLLAVTDSSIDKWRFVLGREAKAHQPMTGCDPKQKGKDRKHPELRAQH